MTILSINKLWKKKDKHFELKDLSLEIQENEWLLVTGFVNDGKEALQQILLGFDMEWNGEFFFRGEEVKTADVLAENVAFLHNHVLQVSSNSNIFEYLAFQIRLKGFKEEEVTIKVKNITKRFFNENELTKNVMNLSIEEKAIVTFLGAIILEPKLIIIEEPFYQLPESERKAVLVSIKKLAIFYRSCPVMVFSSYASEWFDICDRVALFYKNTIIQIGKKSELLNKPSYTFVANYLNSESYSFLSGTFENSYFVSPGLSFSLCSQLFKKSHMYEGLKMTIAIPVKKIQLANDKMVDNSEVVFQAPVHILKAIKDSLMVYSNIGGQPLVAEIKNNDKIYEGQMISLCFSVKDILMFNGNTDKRID